MNAYKPIELLLVEDNPFDEELTVRALRRHHIGNAIHVVRDGAEALDYIFGPDGARDPEGSQALENVPRVILLDLNLPKIGGLEVLRRLKEDPRTRTIPVVVMTSSEEQSDLLRSYNYGANSYVVKPVDFPKYDELVRSLGLYWVLCNKVPDPPASGA